MIPLGIYRTGKVKFSSINQEEERRQRKKSLFGLKDPVEDRNEKEIKFVITNPAKDLKLRGTDLVFVLAQADPGNPDNWDDYNFQQFGHDFEPKTNSDDMGRTKGTYGITEEDEFGD